MLACLVLLFCIFAVRCSRLKLESAWLKAMYEIVIVLLLLVSVAIIALILVQQGKGAGMGASFGAGASNTVFGAVGSGNFLTRSTWFLALVFFGICLLIGYLQKQDTTPTGNFTNIEETAPAEVAAPAPEDVPTLDSDVPSLGVSTNDAPALETVESDTPVLDSVESDVTDEVVTDDAAADAATASDDVATDEATGEAVADGCRHC